MQSMLKETRQHICQWGCGSYMKQTHFSLIAQEIKFTRSVENSALCNWLMEAVRIYRLTSGVMAEGRVCCVTGLAWTQFFNLVAADPVHCRTCNPTMTAFCCQKECHKLSCIPSGNGTREKASYTVKRICCAEELLHHAIYEHNMTMCPAHMHSLICYIQNSIPQRKGLRADKASGHQLRTSHISGIISL